MIRQMIEMSPREQFDAVTTEARVPCNGCFACCRNVVILLPLDDPRDYAVSPIRGPAGQSGWQLQTKPNGDCIYLDRATGCTIYQRRPTMCRGFDCRLFYAKHSRRARRAAIAQGDAVMKAGRDRQDTLP